MRSPRFSTVPAPPGRVGSLGEYLSRAKVMFLRCESRVKKQEGHSSQAGKESQCPALQESQRVPVTPGRHRHSPVSLLQTSGRVPSASHWHAAEDENKKMTTEHLG